MQKFVVRFSLTNRSWGVALPRSTVVIGIPQSLVKHAHVCVCVCVFGRATCSACPSESVNMPGDVQSSDESDGFSNADAIGSPTFGAGQ